MEANGLGGPMFWAGAMMAFTPIVAALVVIGIWWHLRKKKNAGESAAARGD